MNRHHEPASPGDESLASADIPGTALCIAILVGLCLVWPIAPANANEPAGPAPAEISTVHRAARNAVQSMRAQDPAVHTPGCGERCAAPRLRADPEDMAMQLGGTSAFDLISDKRELRFKWRGSKEGIREQSLKLRVSRNRSALTWEARF